MLQNEKILMTGPTSGVGFPVAQAEPRYSNWMMSRTQRPVLAEQRAAGRRHRRAITGAQSREALINAAEELFAQFGVGAVSIRSINAAAGLTPPSVHYHFRSKDRLLTAVLARHGAGISRRVDELLSALETQRRTPTAEDLLTAIVTAYVELMRRDPVSGTRWARIVGQLWSSQDPRLRPLNQMFGSLRERFLGLLRQAFPKVPRRVLAPTWFLATSMLIQTLGNMGALLAKGSKGDRAFRAYVNMLVTFVTAGFLGAMAAATPDSGRKTTRDPRALGQSGLRRTARLVGRLR